MTFFTSHPRWQVETSTDQFQYPVKEKAVSKYEDLVLKKIPCELFLDGVIQKEYKPLINT
tara:strand:+ start:604 stop:783 length:180 start_codon:yes stop_codon:yes gene_type:complete